MLELYSQILLITFHHFKNSCYLKKQPQFIDIFKLKIYCVI